MARTAVKSSGIVVPEAPRWHQRILAFIIHIFLSLVAATLRRSYVDRAGLKEGTLQAPSIYCIWHNRLALSMAAYRGYVRKNTKSNGLAAMTSASRDGGMLSRVLEHSEVQPVRG